MSPQLQTNNRLDYLDAVRGFALILGIIFHAGLSFVPVFIGWAVMDISTSWLAAVFSLVSHSFRMALFFLIAGFFSHMTLHRHGISVFVRSRLVRIGVPLLIGWLILRPLLVSGWVAGAQSMQGEADIIGSLAIGVSSLTKLPQDLLAGTHLWFLYYLLLISALTIALRYLICLHKPFSTAITSLAEAVIGWLSKSTMGIIIMAVPTTICLWFMSRWGMDTPDKSLIPHLPVTLIYGVFFVFGWLLQRKPQQIEHFARFSWAKSLLCLATIVVCISLSSYEMQPAHQDYSFFKGAFMLSYALMMWSLVSLSIGLCRKLFSQPNKIVRYIADSSYWLYLLHLPLIVFLQIAVAELTLHWSIKLTLISAITLAISLLLYDVFVRPTFIGKVLNGRRKPRQLFKQSSRGIKTALEP